MSFQNVFGGSTLQPADVAYRAIALAANLQLAWPPLSLDPSTVAARTMDVSPSASSLSLSLPPANQVSTGYDLLISNRGVNSFTVKDSAGGTIVVIAPGASKYVQVTDNTTLGGVWNTIAFGAVTAAADASSLVNNLGVSASGPYLYASGPVTTFSAGNTIAATDRAKVYVWTGGAGTQTLPAVGGVGSDFWYEVRNQGTGTLTLAANGAELIDGASTIVFQPTESAVIHGGVGNWYTVGRGRSVQFSFTLLVKNITGGTVTLTSTEAANVVQRYTGVLTSNANIVLPPVVQVYYVSNQTTGAFSVTFKTAGAGGTVSVPTGQNAVLFCDGTNVINTSTTVSGISSLTLGQGSVSVPSLNYSGDTSTGLYQTSSGHVNVSISGVLLGDFSSTGLALSGALSATTGAFSGLVTAATVPTLPAHLTNKAYVDAQISGGGFLPLAGGTMTGTIVSNVTEALRITNATGIITGYNAANSVRTGYIQFASAGAVNIQAEVGTLNLKAQAGFGLQIDASGNVGVGGAPSTKFDVSDTVNSSLFARVGNSNAGAAAVSGFSLNNNLGTSAQYGLTSGGFTPSGVFVADAAYLFGGGAGGLALAAGGGPITFATGGSAEKMRLDVNGNLGIGTGSNNVVGRMNLRLDTGDGPLLVLENRVVNGAVHKFGALVFAPYRDVADPAYGAAVWAEGVTPAGYSADLVFGTGVNGGATIPTERLRIDSAGNVLIGGAAASAFATAGRGLLEVSGSSNALVALKVGSTATAYFYSDGTNASVGSSVAGTMTLVTSSVGRMTITAAGVIQDAVGNELGYKDAVQFLTTGAYTLVATDRGKCITANAGGNITIPAGIFTQGGAVVTIYNNLGSAVTLVQGAGLTLRFLPQATPLTGNRTLANNGICTIYFITLNVAVISGSGVT